MDELRTMRGGMPMVQIAAGYDGKAVRADAAELLAEAGLQLERMP